MPKKIAVGIKSAWILGCATIVAAIIGAIVVLIHRESPVDNNAKTVTTIGGNSPAAQSVTASGNNSTVIQAASGATVNATMSPNNATNHVVEGDFNTVYGNVPQNIHGFGNTIVGATDSHGNTIITQSMAVGFNAHAGPGSIAIGANAGAGQSTTPNTNQ